MRIAFLSFSAVPFGSNDLLYYKSALKAIEQGHDVLLAPFDWRSENASEYNTAADAGATVFYRNSYRRHPNFFGRQWQKLSFRYRDAKEDFSFLRSWPPDLVVLSDAATYHMLSCPGLAEFLEVHSIPYLTISQFNDENTTISPALFGKARRFFAKAKSNIFVSQRNLDVARRQLCLSLPNAIVFDNPPNLHSWGYIAFPHSEIVSMAIVARLECAVKGQAIVLEVLAGPQWRDREWTLEIYGGGPDEAYLRELISFLRLSDRVTLCGVSKDVRGVWRRNMLLLMCSSGEGKPLALTEALVCGRPAVVTDVGGNAELVEEGVSGYVAESATVRSFSAAMERAWADRESWASMGERGHSRMVERLTPPPEEKLLELIIASGK